VIVVAELPFSEWVRLMESSGLQKELTLAGHKAHTSSQRYTLFRSTHPGHGPSCVKCGCVGVVMRLEKLEHPDPRTPPNRAHFNLYTADGVLLTKDHILARSKGGKNELENYQTMCAPCNLKKGAK